MCEPAGYFGGTIGTVPDSARYGRLLVPLANQRTNAMSHTTTGLDQTEEEILNYEFSDDALETAGGTGEKITGNPTSPLALICIPFSAESGR
jgi:hypothetical protein